MRVTLVAETFSPAVNGVVNSVLRAAEGLLERGHEPIVIAPSGQAFQTRFGRVDVHRVPAVPLPGYRGLRIAFQTDLSGFLRRYHLRAAGPALWAWLRRLHNAADLTLVPSSSTAHQLRRHGIHELALWPRGVDAELFHPARRDEALRAELAGGEVGTVVAGFVGRLAPEKRVAALAPLSRAPGV